MKQTKEQKNLETYINTMLRDIADYTNQEPFVLMREYIELGNTTLDLYYLDNNFGFPTEKKRIEIYEKCVESIFDKYMKVKVKK